MNGSQAAVDAIRSRDTTRDSARTAHYRAKGFFFTLQYVYYKLHVCTRRVGIGTRARARAHVHTTIILLRLLLFIYFNLYIKILLSSYLFIISFLFYFLFFSPWCGERPRHHVLSP